TNQEIRRRFPKQFRFIFRNFPLVKFHPFAEKAAEAAECAADQDKFWPMHDRMYAADGELAVVQLKFYAQDVGLDTAKFNACLDSGEKAARVQEDIADGKAVGIGATPTFYINGQKHVGGLNMQDFTSIVSSAPAPKPVAAEPLPSERPAPADVVAKPVVAEKRRASEPQSSPSSATPKPQPVETASAGTSIVPGLAPASNPLVIG